MGADHKLDLTSDVTHLLVGDANTPKYKYVAREREDVKVLRPEWIEAVRDTWMQDDGIDLNALEAQYKLPTFAGLTICITGFDDLGFRAQLQQKIDKEGGKYTGDLTKHVTHLIVYKAEGKKYQYAMQWQKQIVTLQWLKDSLERGMQLDETKYHPSIAPEDQGKGAWNKEAKYANQLGKRSRPQEPVVEPSRKLRRTASAKFSSQNDEIWADIYRKPGTEQQAREPLRPSKSMPAIRPPTERNAGNAESVKPSGRKAVTDHETQPTNHRTSELSHGFLDGCYFVLDSFDARKTGILKGIVLGQGGTLLQTLKDLDDLEHVPIEECFLIIPHDIGATSATEIVKRGGHCQVVTELWVEICVEKKQRVIPSTYPLGTLLLPLGNLLLWNGKPQKLSVNSSGFPGIQRNHVAKAVHAMGATYEEVLKPGVSVLICYSASSSVDKMRHAREWKVPVVTPEWLWATLKNAAAASFHEYTLRSNSPSENLEPVKNQVRMHIQDSFANEDRVVGQGLTRFADEVPTQPLPKKPSGEELAAKERPGSDFLHAKKATTHYSAERATESRERAHVTHARPNNCVDAGSDLPLQETSGNSPPKARSSSPKNRKPLFQTLDGAGSVPESDQDDSRPKAVLHPGLEAKKDSQAAGLLNGAIQDLLNQTARTKSLTSSALAAQTNKQPLSRALSNISNASMGSRARTSRAGSVSSINTDGLGSEIVMEPTEPGRTASSSRGRGSFTGRAKARDESQAVQRPASVELNDPGMYREDLAEEEVAPQLTQLGYEDPEEAIALRAKLAEKRRKKSRAGQEEPGTEGVKEKARLPRRIQDDEAILGAKWAGGRRLRQHQKD